ALGSTLTTDATHGNATVSIASGQSTMFTITNNGTTNSSSTAALLINDANGSATNNALLIQSGGTPSFMINENGIVSLNGGSNPDITTLVAGNGITVQPLASSVTSG